MYVYVLDLNLLDGKPAGEAEFRQSPRGVVNDRQSLTGVTPRAHWRISLRVRLAGLHATEAGPE